MNALTGFILGVLFGVMASSLRRRGGPASPHFTTHRGGSVSPPCPPRRDFNAPPPACE